MKKIDVYSSPFDFLPEETSQEVLKEIWERYALLMPIFQHKMLILGTLFPNILTPEEWVEEISSYRFAQKIWKKSRGEHLPSAEELCQIRDQTGGNLDYALNLYFAMRDDASRGLNFENDDQICESPGTYGVFRTFPPDHEDLEIAVSDIYMLYYPLEKKHD